MKKLLISLLLCIPLISQGKVVKQYDGLIIKGKCVFNMKVRSNIVGNFLREYIENDRYKVNGIQSDDYRVKLYMYDKKQKLNISREIRFCYFPD